MSPQVKPMIIIIHGGWHVPEHYRKLARALEAQGYEVHVPRLPSTNGARPPNADLFTDSLFIRSYVEGLVRTGRAVVALMHSYGGQVGTNSLYDLGLGTRTIQGQQGGIVHLLYLAAHAFPENTAMIDKVKEFHDLELVPLTFDFADDGSCLFRDPKTLMIGPGAGNEEVDFYLRTLVRWNGRCMYQRIEHAAWRNIPVSYIYATTDMTIPLDYQKNFVEGLENSGCKVQTFELETGHCPNLTATDGIVDIVNKIIAD
ncbi:Alpha/beta hydrolase fold-1 [Nemania sp. FL0916]|nr:Alpha/beta hydrolase fold-1 [Nemania sp. FL0916]